MGQDLPKVTQPPVWGLGWKTTVGLQTALLPKAAPAPPPGVSAGQLPGAQSESPGSSLPWGLGSCWNSWHQAGSAHLGTRPRLNLPLSPFCWVCTHNADSEDCNILSQRALKRDTLPTTPMHCLEQTGLKWWEGTYGKVRCRTERSQQGDDEQSGSVMLGLSVLVCKWDSLIVKA